MYTRKKTVYYCEFCRKYKLTPQSMVIHERHCTANPDRKCRMPGCRTYLGPCPLCEFSKDRCSNWRLGTWMLKDRNLKKEVAEWRSRFYKNAQYA